MRIDFHASAEPTLGVEWELAIVDRRTRDLRNEAAHLFARAKPRLPNPERLHKELLKNTVEVVTGICHTVPEAMTELRRALEVIALAESTKDAVRAAVTERQTPFDGTADRWFPVLEGILE